MVNSQNEISLFIRENTPLSYQQGKLSEDPSSTLESTIDAIRQYVLQHPTDLKESKDLLVKISTLPVNASLVNLLSRQLLNRLSLDDLKELNQEASDTVVLKMCAQGYSGKHFPLVLEIFERLAKETNPSKEACALAVEVFANPSFRDPEGTAVWELRKILEKNGSLRISEDSFVHLRMIYKNDPHMIQLLNEKIEETLEGTKELIEESSGGEIRQTNLLMKLLQNKDYSSIEYLCKHYLDQYTQSPLLAALSKAEDVESVSKLLSLAQPLKTKSAMLYVAALKNPKISKELIHLLVNMNLPVTPYDLGVHLQQIVNQEYNDLFLFLFSGKRPPNEPIPDELFFDDRLGKLTQKHYDAILSYYTDETIQANLRHSSKQRENVMTTWDPKVLPCFLGDFEPFDDNLLINNRHVDFLTLNELLQETNWSDEKIGEFFTLAFVHGNSKLLHDLASNFPNLFSDWCVKNTQCLSGQCNEEFFLTLQQLSIKQPLLRKMLQSEENIKGSLANRNYPKGYLQSVLQDRPFPQQILNEMLGLGGANQVIDLIELEQLTLFMPTGENLFHVLARMDFPLTPFFEVIDLLMADPKYGIGSTKIALMLNAGNPMTPFEIFLQKTTLEFRDINKFKGHGYQLDISKILPVAIKFHQVEVILTFEPSELGIDFGLVEDFFKSKIGNKSTYDSHLRSIQQGEPDKFRRLLEFGLSIGFISEHLWEIITLNQMDQDQKTLEILVHYYQLGCDLEPVLLDACKSGSSSEVIQLLNKKNFLEIFVTSKIVELNEKEKNRLIEKLFIAGVKWESLLNHDLASLICSDLEEKWLIYLINKGFPLPFKNIIHILKNIQLSKPCLGQLIGAPFAIDPLRFINEVSKELSSKTPTEITKFTLSFLDSQSERVWPLLLKMPLQLQTALLVQILSNANSCPQLYKQFCDFNLEALRDGKRDELHTHFADALFQAKIGLEPFYHTNPDLFIHWVKKTFIEADINVIIGMQQFFAKQFVKDLYKFIIEADYSTKEKIKIMQRFHNIHKPSPFFQAWVKDTSDHGELFRAALQESPSEFLDQFISYEMNRNKAKTIETIARNLQFCSSDKFVYLLEKLDNNKKNQILRAIKQMQPEIIVLLKLLEKFEDFFSHDLSPFAQNFLDDLFIHLLRYQDKSGNTLLLHYLSNKQWYEATAILKEPEVLLGGVNKQGYSPMDYFLNHELGPDAFAYLCERRSCTVDDLKRALYRAPTDQALNFIKRCSRLDLSRLVEHTLVIPMLDTFLQSKFPLRLPPLTSYKDIEEAALKIQNSLNVSHRIDPFSYSVKIPTIEIPKIDPQVADYRELNTYFDKYVTADVVAFDAGLSLNFSDLKSRLNLLLMYLDEEKHVAPLPSDPSERHRMYEKLKNIYRNLIVKWKEVSDPDIIRSSLIEIAKGGPPYCFTRWETESLFSLEELLKDPNQEMTIDVEIYSLVAEECRAIFFELVEHLNKIHFPKSPGNHLHTPTQLLYLLRPDPHEAIAPEGRGIRLNQEVKEDSYGPNITRAKAIALYDERCTPRRILKGIVERVNSFDMPLLKRNLIEDWCVENLFSLEDKELNEQELLLIDKIGQKIFHSSSTLPSFDSEKLGVILEAPHRDPALLLEELAELLPGLNHLSLPSATNKEKFQAFIRALMTDSPYDGSEEEKKLIETIKGNPKVNTILTGWLFRGAFQRLGMPATNAKASSLVAKLKNSFEKFLNNPQFKASVCFYLVESDVSTVMKTFAQLIESNRIPDALLRECQVNEIPVNEEELTRWRQNPTEESLKIFLNNAVKRKKIQQLKLRLYETDPATGELAQFDRNNYAIEPDYQSAVSTKTHFKEMYILKMLERLQVLAPITNRS